MSRAAHLLGIDVSTTATKAVLVDAGGRVAAVGSSPHGLATPRPLWAEQEPDEWWGAARAAVGEALVAASAEAASVVAVGLTGQMHGLVLLDAAGSVLRPAILWNDQRAAAQCEEIRRRVGLERLVRITGNDAYPGFSAPKLLWVREHEPEVYGRIRHVLLPKDYLRWRLTGEPATDRAGAGGTLLLDLAARDWSRELLETLEIPAGWLPATHEGTEITGRVTAEAASATGLAAGTPVVGGGGDQAAQAVGVGAVRPGVVALTLGTSGVVFAATDRPVSEPKGRLHAFPHAVPGSWHVMGVMLSAAGSLRWYRDTVAPGMAYDDLLREAEEIERGAEELFFLPYLSGERTPHADPGARGAFVGLTLKHTRAHMTRAVIEGVACGLRDNLTLMAELGLGDVREVRLSGGAAASRLWRRVLADCLGVELVPAEAAEAAALGAALLAGVGAGIWRSVEDACAAAVRLSPPTGFDPDGRRAYDPVYRRFREHYPALAPLFSRTT
ncbi:MAG: xylulokinase [Thermoanaerobaculia bacterium]|nr:xylulokinase [Thermoanaerobaculia bacterium]